MNRRRRASPPASGPRFVSACPDDRDVIFQDVVRGDVRFHIDVIGDPVIMRAEGTPAYNFAVVVDDALMDVTHVVRGEDHISNTPRQILLYQALGFTPPVFAHLSLVMGPDHRPLSKRHGATSVAEFRAKGYLPEALVNYLALIGWSPRERPPADPRPTTRSSCPLTSSLSASRSTGVGLSAGVFDEEKLAWVNRHYLKMADPLRIAELSVPYFRQAGVELTPDRRGLEFLASVDADGDRVGRSARPGAGAADVVVRLRRRSRRWPIRGVRDEMSAQGPHAGRARARRGAGRCRRGSTGSGSARVANEVKARTGQKGKQLFHPIRVALTGRAEGPELDLAFRRSIAAPTCRPTPASRRSSAAASARRHCRARVRAVCREPGAASRSRATRCSVELGPC